MWIFFDKAGRARYGEASRSADFAEHRAM
jgi:hypothetical protein